MAYFQDWLMAYASRLFSFLISKPDVANAIAAAGSAFLAGVACFISFVSLYLTYRLARNQHRHDRMSVRPLPYIAVGDYENRIYVKIQNNGVGPLVLKKATVDGARNPEKSLIEAMPVLPPDCIWSNFVKEIADRSLPPGGELFLIDLSDDGSHPCQTFAVARNDVRCALGFLTIKLEYSDVFEQKFPPSVRRLDWFHRH